MADSTRIEPALMPTSFTPMAKPRSAKSRHREKKSRGQSHAGKKQNERTAGQRQHGAAAHAGNGPSRQRKGNQTAEPHAQQHHAHIGVAQQRPRLMAGMRDITLP